VAAALVLGAACAASSAVMVAQTAAGPTRIRIAAGTVTAEDSRAGLVGTWEPDADLGLPPGSNHVAFFADGIYINPFRNIALVGVWDATASSLTQTPLEIRRLDTGAPVPDLREVFANILWDTPGSAGLTWLTPDRYRQAGLQDAQRRVEPVHDLAAMHAAILDSLLSGAWVHGGGGTLEFLPRGVYREELPGTALAPLVPEAAAVRATLTGRYRVESGTLHRVVERATVAGAEAPIVRSRALTTGRAIEALQLGARPGIRLRVIGRGELLVEGERWQRR
jgi:hypothetical protein